MRLDGFTKRDRGDGQGGMTVLPAPDERTWEVSQPNTGRSGMRRFDRRTRSLLTAAAVVVILVNAGVVWAYWQVTEAGGSARAGASVELTLLGRSDFNRPLPAGQTGHLTVTVTNDYEFPIRITSVKAAPGRAVADDEHRNAGCEDPAVTMTRVAYDVKWNVDGNTIGAFTIPEGLTMAPDGPAACRGATFTVPIQVTGVRQATRG